MPHYNVLFLCTGNSARSIMAEAILNFKGRPAFDAHSAGSHPAGAVRPEALRQLELAHVPTEGLRSKSWNEFAQAGAPEMNFVFTVCDNAAQEVCPIWPGQPMTAHWGIPDPASSQVRRRDRARLSRRVSHAGTADQPVSILADSQSRSPRNPEGDYGGSANSSVAPDFTIFATVGNNSLSSKVLSGRGLLEASWLVADVVVRARDAAPVGARDRR